MTSIILKKKFFTTIKGTYYWKKIIIKNFNKFTHSLYIGNNYIQISIKQIYFSKGFLKSEIFGNFFKP